MDSHQLKFIDACKNGLLEKAQEYYYIANINIHYNNDNAFKWACYNNHLYIAQWLQSINNMQFDTYRCVFIKICINGKINFAKWLCTIHNDIVSHKIGFMMACKYGHLHIVQWLYQFCNINAIDNAKAISWAYRNKHLEVVSWLYQFNFNDEFLSETLFQRACRKDDDMFANQLLKPNTNIMDLKKFPSEKICKSVFNMNDMEIKLFKGIFLSNIKIIKEAIYDHVKEIDYEIKNNPKNIINIINILTLFSTGKNFSETIQKILTSYK